MIGVGQRLRAALRQFAALALCCFAARAFATTLTVTALQLDGAAVEQAADVLVRQSGEEVARRLTLNRGQVFGAGTELTAPRGLQIELTTANSNRITLYPGARFIAAVITDQGESHVPLSGRIVLDVRKALSFFNVSYERITAGVKGTVFVVDVQPQKSFGLQVNEGVVEVEQRMRVAVEGDGQRQAVESDNIRVAEDIKAGESRSYVLNSDAYLARFKTYADAEAFFRRALEEAERSGDPRRIYLATWNLMELYSRLGRFTDLKAMEDQCIRISRELRNASDEASCLQVAASGYKGTGQFAEATERYGRALGIERQLAAGRDTLFVANLLNDVGIIRAVNNEAAGAVEAFESSLQMKQRLFGRQDRSEVASTLSNIGILYRQVGRIDKSLEYAQASLDMVERIYGGRNHPQLATAYAVLGRAYLQTGDVERARAFLQKSHDLMKELYGARDHRDIAGVIGSLGMVYENVGNHQRALALGQEALQMLIRLNVDNDHPDTATALGAVGNAYLGLHRPQEALTYFRRALEMQKRLYAGRDHHEIAGSMLSIGNASVQLGDQQGALAAYQDSLAMLKRLYPGQDTAPIARNLSNIGFVYQAMGAYQRALEYRLEALAMLKRVYGARPHRNVAAVLAEIAKSLDAMGNREKAASYRAASAEMMRALPRTP